MEITKQENCKDSQSIQRGSTWGESEVSHLLSLWSTEKVMQAMNDIHKHRDIHLFLQSEMKKRATTEMSKQFEIK